MRWLLVCTLVVLATSGALGHGRLWKPPNRSSCWRKGIEGCEPNYTDHELFCGGRVKQWFTNGGNCGVCGDDWEKPQPRENEAGGAYAKGVIVENYQSGSVIDIEVQLTAAHMGWFEFRLCKNDDVNKIITHACLNQNLLQLAAGGTRYAVGGSGVGIHKIKAHLPAGLTCTQCVLQWKYHTGNTWGCDDSGKCCNGCSKEQEEFYGCSDISIS